MLLLICICSLSIPPPLTQSFFVFLFLFHSYEDKAAEDVSRMYHYVQESLKIVGKVGEEIPMEMVRLWCRNASAIRVVRCNPLHDEFDNEKFTKGAFGE